jgi:hypothetical protein
VIGTAVYTAAMDENSCGPCEEADGTEGPPGGLPELPTPNPNCQGGDRCRCIWVPVIVDDEFADLRDDDGYGDLGEDPDYEGLIPPVTRVGGANFTRDGDGDGWINDGTPQQRKAPLTPAKGSSKVGDMSDPSETPRRIDTALAETHNEIYKAEDQLTRVHNDLLHTAGAEYRYVGKRRVTDMTVEEARGILGTEIEKLKAHREAHQGEDNPWGGYEGRLAPYEQDQAERALAKEQEYSDKLDDLRRQADDLETAYAGWSRFFLVTSSPGHVHSSMHCSTCRPTTRFGWMPELSGKSEEAAVEELGPTLCTVCFPSAPTSWTEGKKLTAAQAAKKAHKS